MMTVVSGMAVSLKIGLGDQLIAGPAQRADFARSGLRSDNWCMSRRRVRRLQLTSDQRTPEQRLEALVREPNRDRVQRMLIRIRQDLDARPEPGPWIVAARTLSDRLIISFDAFYSFAELFTECLLLEASGADREMVRLESEMAAVERAHGLRDDEYWRLDEAPETWRALSDAWDRRAHEIVAAALRAFGQSDVADDFERRPEEFERRSRKGRVDVFRDDEEFEA